MADEKLEAAAAEAMREGGDIRGRVRDLTLAALRDHKFDLGAIQAVMRDVGSGIKRGAEAQGSGMQDAVTAAFGGLDEALGKSAQNAKLAFEEMSARGRDAIGGDWQAALDTLRKLEGEFVGTVSALAEKSGGLLKQQLHDIATHATRTGTDTGAAVSDVAATFAKRMADASSDAAAAGIDTARALTDRMAEVTSGFLAGVSEAVRPRDRKP
jgi:hypothetical protein